MLKCYVFGNVVKEGEIAETNQIYRVKERREGENRKKERKGEITAKRCWNIQIESLTSVKKK